VAPRRSEDGSEVRYLQLARNVRDPDTSSTYFVTGEADASAVRDQHGNPVPAGGEAGFRAWGKPEDRRDDLPPGCDRHGRHPDGHPLRVWRRPGNTADSPLIRQLTPSRNRLTSGNTLPR
jgi:hypothetical protein